MPDLLLIVIGTVLVNHLVLSGFTGVTSRVPRDEPFAEATAIALATGFVTLMAAALSLGAQRWLLLPLQVGHLHLLVLVAAASGATWLLPFCFGRSAVNFPLVVANGIVLVLALENAIAERAWPAGTAIAVSLAIAFGILLLAFTELLQRMEQTDVPQPFRGAPIAFVTAGLAALGLLGLAGLLPV